VAIATTVIVRDPVDPADLFASARQVVGNPARWNEHSDGVMRWIQAVGGQGAAAQVAVHFPAAGGPWHEEDHPEGYAMVTFTNSGFAGQRARHRRLVEELGMLLAADGLTWVWRYEDGPWQEA
jgi:hypothetical protein